jgi:phosphopantothenoylcysteine decarboxylase/phosphopantothenate--cysteine ligase
MARILLGVCGGIAAYKAAALVSRLVQRGDEVDVVLTGEAQRFVGELTFAALTRRRVYTALWDAPETIPHIALVRAADVLAIVPATANTLGKIALGLADDLLTNAALAARIPIVVAPAMNSAMYEHPAVAAHLATLRSRGVRIVEPETGFLAERETGVGRLANEAALLAAIDAAVADAAVADLAGVRVLVTAGPTREAIDPVRFLSNAATGTMGIAIAAEAARRGAIVSLVLGPTHVAPPVGAALARVTSAAEMAEAVFARADGAEIVIATAAVADFRPAITHEHKVKKSRAAPEPLVLERTIDILATLGARNAERDDPAFLVGFAAETERFEEHARAKLASKRLDAVAVNDVGRSDSGFGTGGNALVLLGRDDRRIDLGSGAKDALAVRFWDAIAVLRAKRTQ